MIGYIYKCVCLITEKVYIGQTIQKYEERWKDHNLEAFNDNLPSYNYKFHKAIRKFGPENFKWSVIETVSCENVENLLEILNSLEIKYINQYNSYYDGYNSTEGGKSRLREYKQVISYNENGRKLKEFESAIDAGKYYNIDAQQVRRCCGRHTKCVFINNKKIVFRYFGDIYSLEEIEQVKKHKVPKKINAFDLDGALLKSFNSIDEASKYYNVRKQRIITCCNKETNCVKSQNGKIIFRFSGENCSTYELNLAKDVQFGSKPVCCIDLKTNKILDTYSSISEAEKIYKIQRGKISLACNGKRRSAGKYKGHPLTWKFIEK